MIDVLNEIPEEVQGKRVVLTRSANLIDDPPIFLSAPLESPTWLQIAVVANQMLIETDGYHDILDGIIGPVRTYEDEDGPISEFQFDMDY